MKSIEREIARALMLALVIVCCLSYGCRTTRRTYVDDDGRTVHEKVTEPDAETIKVIADKTVEALEQQNRGRTVTAGAHQPAVCGPCRGSGALMCAYGPCPGCGLTGWLRCGSCGGSGRR